MTFRLLSMLMVFALLISCKDEKERKELPLRFEKQSIIRKEGTNCEQEDFNCTIISLDVLRARGEAEVATRINEKLRAHIIRMISSEENPQLETLEDLADTFIREYLQAAEDFSEEPAWEAYINQNIYFRNENIISIGVTAEVFTGGAHGYKTLQFLNFDPATGKTYSNEDLFEPEFLELAEARFRQDQEIPAEDNINSTGFWFENDTFHLPENIGFSEENLILVYNSYEIAPYAAGDIYLEIPLQEAEPFLKIQ